MPMPEPKNKENKQKFVSRCIAEITREEKDRFPDSKQRAAICYSQWGETPQEKTKAAKKSKARAKAKTKQ